MRCKLDETYDCGPVFDFSHTAELIQLGEEAAATALEAASLPSASPSSSVAAAVTASIAESASKEGSVSRASVA